MRTASLALVLAFLTAVPALADDPEPPRPNQQQLLLELRLPRVGLPPVGKLTPLMPDLKGTNLEAYVDRTKADSPVKKAVRAAQVALWACSHEVAPVPLQAEVVEARKKGKIDPQVLKLRYAIPNGGPAETRLKDEVQQTSKQMTRLCAYLEDALDALKEVEDQAKKEGLRWEAHVALLRAWLLLRLVALDEHQSALGRLRKDFPDHDPGRHAAWQLVPGERLVESEAKKHYKDAQKLLEQLQKTHKASAWSKLAQEALAAKLSAQWEAVR